MFDFDFKLTLHWFAREKEWRLYTEAGVYRSFKDLGQLEEATRLLIFNNCRLVLKDILPGEH